MAQVYTDAGQGLVIDLIDPATRSGVTWGSGSTAPAVTQTTLVTELAESRVATTNSQPASNTVRHVFEITATANRTVNEWGVFSATSAGTMLYRGTLSTLNIETGDRVEFTIDHVQKDSSE